MLGAAAGCSGGEPKDAATEFGCGAIDGLAAISGENAPTYILVGENIETKEAPAAFAELACQLAARQPKDQPLWVGLPEHVGGSTDQEKAMRERFKALIARGAPIVVGDALNGLTVGVSRREENEREWADTINASMKAAGAGRALILAPRSYCVAEQVLPDDPRLEAYTPMALFLPEGQVTNLEIGKASGIGAPTIRIYLRLTRGYMGQIALGTLTPAQKSDSDIKKD